jgi:hypothetical protein
MKKMSLSSRPKGARNAADSPVEMRSTYDRHAMNKSYSASMGPLKKRGTRGKKSKSY